MILERTPWRVIESDAGARAPWTVVVLLPRSNAVVGHLVNCRTDTGSGLGEAGFEGPPIAGIGDLSAHSATDHHPLRLDNRSQIS